ncbi:MAG: O-antigen ligase family protein [Patescibacteria group bacterium]|nr:O-antigen ligase family protein [Patescibacteria group bacterium]
MKKLFEYSLYLFIFLLPLQTCFIIRNVIINGYKWQYGTICFYLSDAVLIVLLLSGLYNLILKIKKNPPLKTSWRMAITAILGLFICYSFISVFWAIDKQLACYSAIKLASAIALIFIILNTRINWKKILIIFILSAVLQAGLGIWQFSNQKTFSNSWLGISSYDPSDVGVSVVQTTEHRRWLRSYGGFQHPNIFSGYLSIALLSAIGLYLKTQKSEKNYQNLLQNSFILFSVIILFTALLTSFSRASWLALAIGCASIFFFKLIKKDKDDLFSLFKIFLIFILISGILGFIFKEAFIARLSMNNRLEVKSITERIDYSLQAKNLIKNNLFFGVGVGNYTLANYHKINKEYPAWYFQPVHNTYILILVELGIIGATLFLALLILLFYKSLKLTSIIFKNNNFTIIFFSCLLSLFVIMFFDHWLWSSHFGILLFWLIFGIYLKFLNASEIKN